MFRKYFNSIELKGLLLFFREIFQNPSAVGAVVPSSKHLAKNLANHVLPYSGDEGLIIELGAGTGVVTDALLKQGISPEKIIVVERSEAFAEHLQKRYPKIKIIHGDAMQLKQLIGNNTNKINTIVSSLPLRSLPESTVKAIVEQLKLVLKPGDLFIQYTYSFAPSSAVLISNFYLISTKRIWINIPPARIEVYIIPGQRHCHSERGEES